jgi:hypothetical protein
LDKGGSLQEGTLVRKAPNVDASFRDNEIWMKVGQPFWEGTLLRKAPNVDASLEIMTIQRRLVFDVESCVLLASTLFSRRVYSNLSPINLCI